MNPHPYTITSPPNNILTPPPQARGRGGTCPKSSIKTKSVNRKPCLAGLSPRIICQTSPFLLKMSQNCCNQQLWTVIPSPEPLWVTLWDREKFYPTAKDLLIAPIRKIPLNRFKSFAVKSFISSPSNSNFQVIILCNFHL